MTNFQPAVSAALNSLLKLTFQQLLFILISVKICTKTPIWDCFILKTKLGLCVGASIEAKLQHNFESVTLSVTFWLFFPSDPWLDLSSQWRIYIVKFWTRPPPGLKFFQFHAVFGKIWQNRMLAPPPPGVGPPLLGEILDPPLHLFEYFFPFWSEFDFVKLVKSKINH